MADYENLNLLSRDEVMDLLGISEATLHRLNHNAPENGFAEKIKISPGRVLYRENEVMSYIENRKVSNN